MALHLYDTWTRSQREFTPLKPGEVGLYTCGPTVYNYAHIGNLRTYLFEDGLVRAQTQWLPREPRNEHHRCGAFGVRW